MSKKKIIVIYSIVVVFLTGWFSPFVINHMVNNNNFYPLELKDNREHFEISSVAESIAKILTPEVSSIVIDSRPDGYLNYGKYKLITSRYGYNKTFPTKNSVLGFYQFDLKRSKITNSSSTILDNHIQKKIIRKSIFEASSEITSSLWNEVDDKKHYYAYFSMKEEIEADLKIENQIDEKYRNSKGLSIVEWVGVYADTINSYVWGMPAGNRKTFLNLTNEFAGRDNIWGYFISLVGSSDSVKLISEMELFGDLSVYDFKTLRDSVNENEDKVLGFMMYTTGDELKLFKQNTEIQLVKLSEPEYPIL